STGPSTPRESLGNRSTRSSRRRCTAATRERLPCRRRRAAGDLTDGQGRQRNAGMTVWRRAAAEALGTALLLAAVVGSGIMGERLAGGNTAIALLANSLATGGALVALIAAFA